MVNSLENIDKSKVYVDRIEGLNEVVEDVIGDTLVGAVSTITTSDLTANKILVSDANGKVAAGSKGINDLQDTLISGTNIKTINGSSILGSGNIAVESGANTSLSNLTTQGQNIANWSNNVTNCITEIPQDIKLELNYGTLTLKAGSKVYIPNGVGVFDTRVFTQDVSVGHLGSVTGQFILTYGQSAWASEDAFDYYNVSQSNLFSGPSQPTTTSINTMWYDTTNNVIKTTSDKGSTWTITNNTFPICIVTVSFGIITSIDQVFNGFGYIGSTIFALPGVKGLIPNGRNVDGTLNSIEKETEKVITNTYGSASVAHTYTFFVSEDDGWSRRDDVISYNENENYYKEASGNFTSGFAISNFTADSSGKITSFIPKAVFHTADNNTVVHLTGTETITGGKTFTGSAFSDHPSEANILIKENNVDARATPAANVYNGLYFTDKNNLLIGVLETTIRNSGRNDIKISAYGQDGTSGSVAVCVDSTGKIWAVAPASDTNTSIVTTINKSKAANGYFQLGNGMIIQWGKGTATNTYTNVQTITLPKAFSNTNYSITFGTLLTTQNKKCEKMFHIQNKTTTNFQAYCSYTGGTNDTTVSPTWIAIGY